MERCFVILLHPSFNNVISLNIIPLNRFHFQLVNANDSHYRHRIKICFIKKEHMSSFNLKKFKM